MTRRTSLAVCALAVVLAGCGSGRNAQVLQERTVVNGANADLPTGTVQVRNVYATPTDVTQAQVPAGGSVDLHFHVFNQGDQPELMVASSPALLAGTGVVAGAVTVPPHTSLWVGGPGSAVTGTITQLPEAVWVGTYVTLTLEFNNAGHVDLTVPVEDATQAQS
ncbi:MAG: hypothetical protein ACJ735_11715 [Actinomycetes bacterium]